jgi:hypothetical protein
MALFKSIFMFTLLFVLSGCGGVAIYNVTNQSVPSISRVKTADEMKKAIYAACFGRGWTVKDISPDMIVATLILRDSMAIVEIKYDSKNYNIFYKESTGLKSDGQTIHKNYNSWIQNLDNDIQNNLTLM